MRDIRDLLTGNDDLPARHAAVAPLVELLLKRRAQLAMPTPSHSSMDAIFQGAEHAVTAAQAKEALVAAAPALLEAWAFYQETRG